MSAIVIYLMVSLLCDLSLTPSLPKLLHGNKYSSRLPDKKTQLHPVNIY